MKALFKCHIQTVIFKTGNNLLVFGLKDGCGIWWKELINNNLDGSNKGNGRDIVYQQQSFLIKIFVNNTLRLVIKPGSSHPHFVVAFPYDW
jgi:hypothetical protein